jgi:hypothetical protein
MEKSTSDLGCTSGQQQHTITSGFRSSTSSFAPQSMTFLRKPRTLFNSISRASETFFLGCWILFIERVHMQDTTLKHASLELQQTSCERNAKGDTNINSKQDNKERTRHDTTTVRRANYQNERRRISQESATKKSHKAVEGE